MPKSSCRGSNTGIAIVRVTAQSPARLAIAIHIASRQDTHFLKNDILDHTAVTLRHQECIRRVPGGIPPHQLKINGIYDLCTGIG
jgi:hypothetical protein